MLFSCNCTGIKINHKDAFIRELTVNFDRDISLIFEAKISLFTFILCYAFHLLTIIVTIRIFNGNLSIYQLS